MATTSGGRKPWMNAVSIGLTSKTGRSQWKAGVRASPWRFASEEAKPTGMVYPRMSATTAAHTSPVRTRRTQAGAVRFRQRRCLGAGASST